MSDIRDLAAADLEEFTRISSDAFPGALATSEERLARNRRLFGQPHARFVGLFRHGQMAGVMRLYDFTMTVRDQPVRVGGVGGVAVDLLHKKQRVAYEMIQFFLQNCRKEHRPLALLYPFRPDFYTRMGFGYGSKINRYRLDPAALPRTSTADLRPVTEADRAALLACYNRQATVTNGLIRRSERDFDSVFEENAYHAVVCWQGDDVRGYMIYRFQPAEPASFLNNDLHVRELIHETPQALRQLLSFLHVQKDQVQRILFDTQDPHVVHLFSDPRNGSGNLIPSVYHESNVQGVGWMPRVVDVPTLFASLAESNFGGQSLRLRLDLIDDFLPQNQTATLLSFDNGWVHVGAESEPDVILRLHVREFSSLILGVVDLSWLARHGLAEVSDPKWLMPLHRLFAWHQAPICLTTF